MQALKSVIGHISKTNIKPKINVMDRNHMFGGFNVRLCVMHAILVGSINLKKMVQVCD